MSLGGSGACSGHTQAGAPSSRLNSSLYPASSGDSTSGKHWIAASILSLEKFGQQSSSSFFLRPICLFLIFFLIVFFVYGPVIHLIKSWIRKGGSKA